MTDMKCPFCNQELDRDLKGECGCINEQCQKSVFMFGSEELWQELIRTRKALKTAVDALKEIKDGKIPVSLGIYMDINDAIEQITTLEQKDK